MVIAGENIAIRMRNTIYETILSQVLPLLTVSSSSSCRLLIV